MTTIPVNVRMKGTREITAVNMGDPPSMTAAYTETKSDASLCIELVRSVSMAASRVLRCLFLSALSVMKAPKSPDTPIARHAAKPAVTIISG